MIRTIIIDDEKNAREAIAYMVRSYCPDILLVGEAENITDGKTLLLKEKPDLVLLDIKLGKHLSFELLKDISDIRFKIIFITAHEEFALEAFRFSAVDYLLKPVDKNDLIAAINKSKIVYPEQERIKLSALENNFGINKTERKIVLNTSDSMFVIAIQDIIRCESDSRYTSFFINNREKIVVSKPLKEYDELLHPYNFIRIHQSHLINPAYLLRYKKRDGGWAEMKDGSLLPVSTRQKDVLMDYLKAI